MPKSELKLLVTGGAGFIGSNFSRLALENNLEVMNLDKLTYAGSLHNIQDLLKNPKHHFIKIDITDKENILPILNEFKPNVIVNFAAESHVDRSIDNAENFINTNINGSYNMYNAAIQFWQSHKDHDFKFIQISTDEVFGSITTGSFNELSPYQPSSPYSASKASADLILMSYYKTLKFPACIIHSSNNYGPYQYPEKFIPLTILNALEEKPIPLYGDGLQIRNWLFVLDNINAILKLCLYGQAGEHYCCGANSSNAEKTNIEVATTICKILDQLKPRANNQSYQTLIKLVQDRPGHDRRYAISSEKLKSLCSWEPSTDFYDGLYKTVNWYIANTSWVKAIGQNQARERQGLKNFI